MHHVVYTPTASAATAATVANPTPPRFGRTGRIPVAAEEDLKDYDPAKPIHQGWDSYRYAPKEVDAGAGVETSLERAMRLRREFLDALKECGATAAQEFSLFDGGNIPAAKVQSKLLYKTVVV